MIRDLNNYINSLWDWDFASQALPGKAAISDVDGYVERGGYMLLLEGKYPGAPVPKGQEIAFKNLTASGMVTVICLWGTDSQPQQMQIRTDGRPGERGPVTQETVVQTVSAWYRWASHQPRPKLQGQQQPFTLKV